MGVLVGRHVPRDVVPRRRGRAPSRARSETVISQIGRAVFGTGVRLLRPAVLDDGHPRSWPPTRPLPTSRGCRRSSPETGSCRAGSRSAASGSRSAPGSSRSRSCRSSCSPPSAAASRRSSRSTRSASSPRSPCRRPGWSSTGGASRERGLASEHRHQRVRRDRDRRSSTVIFAVAKFALGAWLIVIIIPLLVGGDAARSAGNTERRRVETEVREETVIGPPRRHQRVIVPASDVTRDVVQAIRFGRTMSDDVTAVHVTDDVEAGERIRDAVRAPGPRRAVGHRRVAVSLARPAARPVPRGRRRRTHGDDVVVVLLPEYVPRHWWERLPLQRERPPDRARRCSVAPNVLVAEVPFRRDV